MRQKSPSAYDGKPTGVANQARAVQARTRQGRREATRRFGLTFSDGPKRFSRLRLEASLGYTWAAQRLRDRAAKWAVQGWKTKTIAKHLGTSAAAVDAMLRIR